MEIGQKFLVWLVAKRLDLNSSHPFALSLSKGDSWFDKLTTNGKTIMKNNPPFALSVSKGDSWFDKLTTNGKTISPRTEKRS